VPRGAQLNPAPDAGNLLWLKLPSGWHFQVAGLFDRSNEQAFCGITWVDRRSAFATG